MQFSRLVASILSATALVAASVGPLQPRQTIGPGNLLFDGICSSRPVRCEQALGDVGKDLCCRNGNLCSANSTLVTCADGTVARPYNTDAFPSFASLVRTASPLAYTSFLAGVTNNPIVPQTLLDAITGAPSASASESEGAASAMHVPGFGTGVGNTMAVLGIWTVAAIGGAVLVFAQ